MLEAKQKADARRLHKFDETEQTLANLRSALRSGGGSGGGHRHMQLLLLAGGGNDDAGSSSGGVGGKGLVGEMNGGDGALTGGPLAILSTSHSSSASSSPRPPHSYSSSSAYSAAAVASAVAMCGRYAGNALAAMEKRCDELAADMYRRKASKEATAWGVLQATEPPTSAISTVPPVSAIAAGSSSRGGACMLALIVEKAVVVPNKDDDNEGSNDDDDDDDDEDEIHGRKVCRRWVEAAAAVDWTTPAIAAAAVNNRRRWEEGLAAVAAVVAAEAAECKGTRVNRGSIGYSGSSSSSFGGGADLKEPMIVASPHMKLRAGEVFDIPLPVEHPRSLLDWHFALRKDDANEEEVTQGNIGGNGGAYKRVRGKGGVGRGSSDEGDGLSSSEDDKEPNKGLKAEFAAAVAASSSGSSSSAGGGNSSRDLSLLPPSLEMALFLGRPPPKGVDGVEVVPMRPLLRQEHQESGAAVAITAGLHTLRLGE